MDIKYVASPTLARFHASNAPVRGVMGPIGSGKSVGCCAEILIRAHQQAPGPDGVRRTRWAIVRNTYGQLKSTTIKTWTQWCPESVCPIVYDSPIRARMRRKLPDGTIIDMEVLFVSLDRPQDAGKVLSMELTGAWINEARELPKPIIDAVFSRTGRYPSKAECPAGLTWTGLIMDTNPPDTDHWWYQIAENGDSDMSKIIVDGKQIDISWDFFRQPGALIPLVDPDGKIRRYKANPEAENVQHHQLGFQYWTRQIMNKDPEWIKVYCCGDYGTVFDGKPVYFGVYNDLFHVSKTPLGVFRGLPIHLGWDFGLTPACTVGQVTPSGQLRILREYECQRGGVKQFASDIVKPALNRLFTGMPIISTGDPAGKAGAQADIDLNCFAALANLGIPTREAPTNKFELRRQAVLDRLTRTIDGQPAVILDPSCDRIRKGFIGGYHFRRVAVPGEERFKDEPDKNSFSHIHDAVQYLVLGTDSIKAAAVRDAPPPVNPTWGGFV